MRILFVAATLIALVAPALPADKIQLDEYKSRRTALRKDLEGAVVLFGATEGGDDLYGFRQESNFYYLTGWTEPNAVLIVTPSDEMLFLPNHDKHRETFMGHRISGIDPNAGTLTGFEKSLPIEKFESKLHDALAASEKAYILPNQRGGDKLKALYPFRDFGDAGPLIAKLRVKKSPAEIAAIQRATDVGIDAHRAAWKRMASGLYEYQISATVTDVYLENGCERYAYAPIIGSGPNSTVLHYWQNKRRMDSGEVVVMDTAPECSYYASDITRTVPVSGKFTRREREIYEIVLGAQKAAIAAIKPGVQMRGDENSLTKIAKDYMDAHGKDLHGGRLSKYFVHGLGHPVGLDVHDPGVPGPLEAGMVITIEPGIYIPEENIGVRIEDVILVTEKGPKVLSEALPRDPDEIEKALAK